MPQYTALSQQAFDQATNEALTAQEAVRCLTRQPHFRTLPEKLMKFSSASPEEMKAALRQGLSEHHPDPKEKESIRKNVANWFSPPKGPIDDRTISRPYALEMCFLLHLDEQRANDLLCQVTGEGLHYRDLAEFVAGYALRTGMDYPAYLALLEEAGRMAGESSGSIPEGFTRASRDALSAIASREALLRYVQEHRGDFSEHRNTAHGYFIDLMEVLQHDGTDAAVADLVAQNLYRRIVARNGRLSPLEKSIRNGWPEESQLARMRSRELPVTRKVLILLYLASGGEGSTQAPEGYYNSLGDTEDYWDGEDDWEDWDEEEDGDFSALLTQLDAMLVECGFAPMDPRQPFDWMVLFCMATGDLFDLDERFEAVLTSLYGSDVQPA